MTKVLLLSDTHGHIDQRILDYAGEADVVFHAGDIGDISVVDRLKKVSKLYSVYGNIDGSDIRGEIPEEITVDIEKVKIYMHHIGKYPPTYTPTIREKLDNIKPRLYFCGHSHILKVIPDSRRKLIHMNPGACGFHGFHKVRTMIRFQIDGEKILNPEVIELGLRGSIKKIPKG